MAASSNMFGKLSLTKSQPHYGRGKKQPELLPPSSFETAHKQPDDNWKEMAQTTAEILQLTQENIRLRESTLVKTPVVQEAAVSAHQVTAAAPLLDVRHLDDIISRQAVEVAALRRQLAECETQSQRHVALLESQLMLKDAQSTQQVAALEGRIRTLEETHTQQLADKTQELSELEGKWTGEVQRLQDTLDSSARTYTEQVGKLTEKLGAAEALISQTQTETAQRLRQNEEELRTRNETINQLKRYLGESEQVSKSTEIWRKEMENLKNKLQHCESKKRELESSSQLQNVRLTSLNEIFTIHERQISGLDSTGKDSATEKKHTLLTRWREKVYQLLVQLKSAQLMQEIADRDWQMKLQNVENELDSTRNQCQVLEHSLSDRQAQLDLHTMHSNTMQHELRSAQELAIELDDRNKQQKLVVSQLVDSVQGVYEKYCSTAKQQQSALATLSAFSQRIAFASGRMEMLRSQFARREALLRLQTAEGTTEPVNLNQSPPSDTVLCGSELVDQLHSELERVTAERDQLVAQIKVDADQLEGIVTSVHTQAAEEISDVKQKVKDLEVLSEERHKRAVSLAEELEHVKAEAEEAKEATESLKADIARRDLQAEKDVESVKSTMQAEFVEQLAELERRLNDSRREHTKAVVAQRQTERQASRERDRAGEHVHSLEEHYKNQMAALDKKLKSTEKDRNLLMVTLRQEGLIGKYKSQRAAPVGMSSEEPLVSVDGSGDQRRTQEEPPVAGDKEPLESVINDLKSLTAAIIEETSLE